MGTAGAHPGHRPPEAVDKVASAAGLRAVAIFEALKGMVVLALGLGLLALLHKDVEQAAENVLLHLHINPDRRLSHAILDAASRVTDGRLWAVAGAATAYAGVRFTEAWGLWHRRVWAEWFALLSGALYLPWEILKIFERPNWLHVTLLTGNIAIVLYMLYIRLLACRRVP
ncbi:MAG TPA: DUF2127 domain-containing protein [Bryobacteraceae bacterium]|nr:DUF2127 domain-containing protein [Bryobacteraceae bacterium]